MASIKKKQSLQFRQTWPDWKGNPIDIIMYAGYLYGLGLISAPYITMTEGVRLGATEGLYLTICKDDGLVLTCTDGAGILHDEIMTALQPLISNAIFISWSNLPEDIEFITKLDRQTFMLRERQRNNYHKL